MKPTGGTLTNITALTVLVTRQPSVGRVVASYHPPVVVDDCVQVVDRRLLHLILLAYTELTQVQVPSRQQHTSGFSLTV